MKLGPFGGPMLPGSGKERSNNNNNNNNNNNDPPWCPWDDPSAQVVKDLPSALIVGSNCFLPRTLEGRKSNGWMIPPIPAVGPPRGMGLFLQRARKKLGLGHGL